MKFTGKRPPKRYRRVPSSLRFRPGKQKPPKTRCGICRAPIPKGATDCRNCGVSDVTI